MKKSILILTIMTFVSFAFTQSVDIKDNTSNSLITIIDEGPAGSISLPTVGSTLTGTKLYNFGGNLYWNNQQLGTAGSAGGWTRSGTDVHLTTNSDNVGIGTPTPTSTLTVKGADLLGTSHAFTVTDNSDNPALRVFNNRKVGINFAGGPSAMLGVKGEDQLATNSAFKAMDVSANSLLEVRNNGNVSIGPGSPNSKLHIFDNSTNTPQLVLDNQLGDAFIEYHDGSTGTTFSAGNDAADQSFKVTQGGNLTGGAGSTQGDFITNLQTYPGGIVDLNNQSRARAWLGHPQPVPFGAWTPIEFEFVNYDQQLEFTPSPLPGPGSFKATKAGYYQVNARTEFNWTEAQEAINPFGYVSIAIFVNGVIYAQGNNLIMVIQGVGDPLWTNNAPNVSDVVSLMPGDIVEIHAWQNAYPLTIPLNSSGLEKTYVSIHKVS